MMRAALARNLADFRHLLARARRAAAEGRDERAAVLCEAAAARVRRGVVLHELDPQARTPDEAAAQEPRAQAPRGEEPIEEERR